MPSMGQAKPRICPRGSSTASKAIPNVQMVDTLRFVRARAGEFTVVVAAREFSTPGRRMFDIVHGTPKSIFEGLQAGQVAIGSVLAERAQWKLGDELPLETQNEPSISRLLESSTTMLRLDSPST